MGEAKVYYSKSRISSLGRIRVSSYEVLIKKDKDKAIANSFLI